VRIEEYGHAEERAKQNTCCELEV